MDMEILLKNNKARRQNYINIDKSNNKSNNKSVSKYFKNLITRVLITIIFVLGSVIYTNISDENKALYQKYVLENSLEFTKINNLYESIFGSVDLINTSSTTTVSGSSIKYTNIEDYKNGVLLTVGASTTISAITSGIVVYIGEKEDLGNTIIIQGNDGYDIWYSNITDSDITIYDYIEKGSILGIANTENIYLTIIKDGEYISYEEYQNQS